MSTNNHTAISSGAAANASTINTPLGTIDAAVGNLATLTTTDKASAVAAINEVDANADAAVALVGTLASLTTTAKTSAVAAINEVDALIGTAASASGSIGTSIDTDGTLKAGAVDASTVLADNVVTAAKIADNVVGATYAAGTDLTLKAASDRIGAAASASGSIATSIDVDGTLKAGAVDVPAVIAENAIESVNLVHDPYNAIFAPSASAQDGAIRWYTSANISQVTPDANNPYGLPTIRTTSSTGGGKRIYLAEVGLKPGDIISIAVEWRIATGTTARLTVQYLDAAGLGITNTFVGENGADGIAVSKVSAQTIPALCASIALQARSFSGGGNVDVYAWHLVRGAARRTTGMVAESAQARRNTAALEAARGSVTDLATRLNRSLSADGYPLSAPMFVVGGYDPLFRTFEPRVAGSPKTDDLIRYTGAAALSRIIGDTANPFGTPTLRYAVATASTAGIRLHLSDSGLVVGDVISVGVLAKIASTAELRLMVVGRASGGSATGTMSTGTYASGTDATQWFYAANITVPASTSYVEIYFQRNSGSGDADIYGLWVSFGTVIYQDNCEAYGYRAKYDIAELARRTHGEPTTFNLGKLTSWWTALANLEEATVGANANLLIIGDSITNVPLRGIRPLALRLWADYANGGLGWLTAHSEQYLTDGQWTVWQTKYNSLARTGTWTERDIGGTPAGRGLSLSEAESTANTDKYTLSVDATNIDIHYLKYSGGPSFRWQVDSGGWSTVDTDNATDAFGVVEISGLSSAAHSLEVEALGAGVILFGFDCRDLGTANAVVIHKAGEPGSRSDQWEDICATQIWQDALAQMAPDAVLLALGTNENQASTASSGFRTAYLAMIDAIQTALPNCDVGVIVPYHTAPATSANDFETTRRMIRQVAVERGLWCLDLSMWMYDFTHNDALGLMSDDFHTNALGGQIIGKAYYDALKL